MDVVAFGVLEELAATSPPNELSPFLSSSFQMAAGISSPVMGCT